MMTSRIVFFQVKNNPTKLKKLFETALLHFKKKQNFLILTEDTSSQNFVDDFLWKHSFLPHGISDEPTKEKIAISKVKQNINQSSYVFNLCPTPLIIEDSFQIIYEFEDLSAPGKKNISSIKLDAYRNMGWLIEAIPVF